MSLELFYNKIGPAGIFLLILMFISIYLGIKNYIRLGIIEWQFKKFVVGLETEGLNVFLTQKYTHNYLILILSEILQKHRYHSTDLHSEVAFLFHKYFYKVQKNISFLKLISVISPLVGLMGTVLGIINVFNVIGSTNNGQADNSMLALGIGQALYTTVMGMVITIPVLAIFYHLRNRLSGFILEVMEYCYLTIGMIEKKEIENEEI